MISLLVISRQPALATALKSTLDATKYHIISKSDLSEADALVARGAIDVLVLDVEVSDVRAIRTIGELKAIAPHCPIFVYVETKGWEWEEDAYLLGVTHVLTKPIRAKMLHTLLERLFEGAPAPARRLQQEAPQQQSSVSSAVAERRNLEQLRALESLRNFSAVLTEGLDSEALLKRFLALLREVIGVNKAIVFLQKPAGPMVDGVHAKDDRWLRSACAIGIEQSFFEHFALSFRSGIGCYLNRQGRILRAGSEDAQSDRDTAREFRLLGAEVAIPILDRESLIGVAVFDGRLTGEPYTNEELALIFHMLEHVGPAIRNSRLHTQLATNSAMTANILSQIGAGCVVIGSNLSVLHANPAAQELFIRNAAKPRPMEFGDLTQELGSSIFTVLKTGLPAAPFRYELPGSPRNAYRVAITPFKTRSSSIADAALLIVEDVTQTDKAQRLEIESSNLKLVKSMAEHLAHEIGNSLVPLSTHEQLLAEKLAEPEFRASLAEAMSGAVKRISRFANQMVFLARDKTDFAEKIRLGEVIVEAFHEANTFHQGKLARLNFEKSAENWLVAGDYKALRHAFSEVILNALQANPAEPKVDVRIQEDTLEDGGHSLNIEVQDSGAGFPPEVAERANEPFFSTRNVGLGLGLTVTRKIIENHHGKMEIPIFNRDQPGVVRISLPLSS